MNRQNDEYFKAQGNLSAISQKLNIDLPEDILKQCIIFIDQHKEILLDDELFQCSISQESLYGHPAFITDNAEYYISLKLLSIYLSLWLIGKITHIDLLTLAGFTDITAGNLCAKLNEENGERCIMTELARKRKEGADHKLLKKYKGECCNNHLHCQYNHNGRCCCSNERISEILDSFADMKILNKKWKKYYYNL